MRDMHALMGDGEVGNCGVEIGGRAIVRVTVMKGMGISWPMAEIKRQWISMGSAETLDQAAQRAALQVYRFLTSRWGRSPLDAGLCLDMAGNLAVCQMVKTYKTVRMEVGKEVLREMEG